MKRFLFLIILMMGFVISCGNSDITLPNKNIKVEGNVLTFKGKPFTGKIKVNLADKVQGYNGFITFKDGHLDGLTDLNNEKEKEQVKFTVVDGKFEGELLVVDPKQGVSMSFHTEKGKITKIVADVQGMLKYDLTFPEGLANGTFEIQGQKVEFKDGIGKAEGQPGEAKLTINQETGDMEMESIVNGKTQAKQTIPNQLTPEYLEKYLFQSIISVNR